MPPLADQLRFDAVSGVEERENLDHTNVWQIVDAESRSFSVFPKTRYEKIHHRKDLENRSNAYSYDVRLRFRCKVWKIARLMYEE